MKHSIILIVFLFFGCASINKQIISTDKNTMYQERFSKQSEITNEDKCIDFAGTVEDFLHYAKINSGKNNLGVMINASTIEKVYYVELGGIKYLVMDGIYEQFV